MREYETTFIVQPEISDEGRQAVCDRLGTILEGKGSVRLMVDDVGKRRLAYPIKNFQKGHYLTLYYLDEGEVVSDVERQLRLDESILRFLTVKSDEEVADIEARKAEAAEMERVQEQKAAERAAREAEEEKARQVAAEEAAAQAAELAANASAEAAAAAPAEGAEAAESGEAAPTAAPEAEAAAPEAKAESPATDSAESKASDESEVKE